MSTDVMKMQTHVRLIASLVATTCAFAWSAAHADIYTWVDASGAVNLSNREPPAGTRITSVYREDPAARASAEAARATRQRDEMRALNERVAQLERDLEEAKRPPPEPVMATPIVMPTTPAPMAYAPVIAQTFVSPPAPSYDDCSYSGNCFLPGSLGFYPGSIVVVSAPPSHRFRPPHKGDRVRMPPPPRFPTPVGLLPDPPNLFWPLGARQQPSPGRPVIVRRDAPR